MTYTKPRLGAIALGLLCAAGAGAILISDVRHTGTLTTDHMLSVVLLVGTIAAGHMAWDELRAPHPLRAAALALVFLSGSIYCVMSTMERTAEHRQTRALAAQGANEQRGETLRLLAEARRWVARSQENVAKECASGDGKACQGRRATLRVYEAAVIGHEATLAKLPAELPINTRLRVAAALFAALPYVTTPAAEIERRLAIIDPVLPALFLELGSIVFFSIGLGRGRQHRATPGVAPAHPGKRTTPRLASASSRPRDDDSSAVIAALALARRPVSNNELARLLGVSKGEASKRVDAAGALVHKRRIGRHVAITLN